MDKTQLITKGAVEEMLAISSHAEYKGNVEPITDAIRNKILKTVKKLNKMEMRVIAVAQKNNPAVESVFTVEDEADMVLMGYLAFLDPPKKTTRVGIKDLKKYGVTVKVLTGDNDAVTRFICKKVGLKVENLLHGSDIDQMNDTRLGKTLETTSVFAKLSPSKKQELSEFSEKTDTLSALWETASTMLQPCGSDVGISVDTAVDIAKESADIILLEKDLMVLKDGIIEGRKTFGNIIKYIKMTASSNFGNMFSVVAASAFLPFLPMLPVQIILLNLIYDIILHFNSLG